MGAFVGNDTSPFLRRRKGRIGKDIWVEKTAPTFAGAEINSAAGNHICMVCAPNFSAQYQYNRTQGDGAWTSVTIGGLNDRIGNDLTSRSCLTARPFFKDMDIDEWHLQGHFGAVGAVIATGGGAWRISPEGDIPVAQWTVAGAPQKGIAWTNDGRIFLSVGEETTSFARCRGGLVFSAPEVVDIATGVGTSGFRSVIEYLNPAIPASGGIGSPPDAFLAGDTSAGNPIRKLRRRGVNDWLQFKQDANPSNEITRWYQNLTRKLIVGVSFTSDGIRSTDNGLTWAAMDIEAGPVNDVWQYGNRLYVIKRDANRFKISRNFGSSWLTGTVFPSGTFIPNISLTHLGDRYVIGQDGAVNRMYRMKHFMEI